MGGFKAGILIKRKSPNLKLAIAIIFPQNNYLKLYQKNVQIILFKYLKIATLSRIPWLR